MSAIELQTAKSQVVRWASESEHGPGMIVRSEGEEQEQLIPWDELQPELEQILLKSAFADPRPYGIRLEDYHDKPNWLVRIYHKSTGKSYAAVWLGTNPDLGWSVDGLIHIGGTTAPHVWQTYRRYSDGRYERQPSLYGVLEKATAVSGG